jgi:bifunctional UDP-N-acetylglucosamine pyrophosphorylase/glucosamine-1-phosphate N-acetyltransferase
LAIREINTGVMAFPGELLADYLPHVGNDNAQGEYYLPDVLSMAVRDGHEVAGIIAQDVEEVGGINDRVQLAAAETVHRRREADRLMLDGATLVDPARIDVRGHLSVGEDVLIDVNCVFEGEVSVRIGPNCVLRDTQVEAGAQIHAMSHLDGAQVGASCSVGPFARLRPGTRLARGARVGNFVETKKAQVGEGSKINHLSYVGDAVLGAGVNIGAGTITCNYDGQNKHPTQLGDGVFIGSNSTLVAPVEVADGGFVAAGSTLTRDVPAQALGVARARQRNIDSWQTPRQRAQQSESDGSQER